MLKRVLFFKVIMPKITRIQRLSAVIGISFCFFIAEISGMYFIQHYTRKRKTPYKFSESL